MAGKHWLDRGQVGTTPSVDTSTPPSHPNGLRVSILGFRVILNLFSQISYFTKKGCSVINTTPPFPLYQRQVHLPGISCNRLLWSHGPSAFSPSTGPKFTCDAPIKPIRTSSCTQRPGICGEMRMVGRRALLGGLIVDMRHSSGRLCEAIKMAAASPSPPRPHPLPPMSLGGKRGGEHSTSPPACWQPSKVMYHPIDISLLGIFY